MGEITTGGGLDGREYGLADLLGSCHGAGISVKSPADLEP